MIGCGSRNIRVVHRDLGLREGHEDEGEEWMRANTERQSPSLKSGSVMKKALQE